MPVVLLALRRDFLRHVWDAPCGVRHDFHREHPQLFREQFRAVGGLDHASQALRVLLLDGFCSTAQQKFC